MTASDLVVGNIYEGGEYEPRSRRRVTEIQYKHVLYTPVSKRGLERHSVRQNTVDFLRWCNQIATQEIAILAKMEEIKETTNG